MKSNIVLISQDRNLFGTVIRQETKTGFLNLTDLQKAFESVRSLKGWVKKNIGELIARRESLERVFYILEKQNVITYDLSYFMELVEKQGIATYLKSINQYKTTGARETKTTFLNPYIWAMIALELSPEFYANAILWLTDSLILNRIEAGNFYIKLTDSIKKWNLDGYQYAEVAKAINFIVFKEHKIGIRNSASAKELKEIEDIEKKLAFAVDMNYITSFDSLIEELRKMYRIKYNSVN